MGSSSESAPDRCCGSSRCSVGRVLLEPITLKDSLSGKTGGFRDGGNVRAGRSRLRAGGVCGVADRLRVVAVV